MIYLHDRLLNAYVKVYHSSLLPLEWVHCLCLSVQLQLLSPGIGALIMSRCTAPASYPSSWCIAYVQVCRSSFLPLEWVHCLCLGLQFQLPTPGVGADPQPAGVGLLLQASLRKGQFRGQCHGKNVYFWAWELSYIFRFSIKSILPFLVSEASSLSYVLC